MRIRKALLTVLTVSVLLAVSYVYLTGFDVDYQLDDSDNKSATFGDVVSLCHTASSVDVVTLSSSGYEDDFSPDGDIIDGDGGTAPFNCPIIMCCVGCTMLSGWCRC